MQAKSLTSILPLLGHVLISDTGDGRVTLTGTDMDQSARIVLPNQVAPAAREAGSLSVPSRVLLAQARNAVTLADTVQLRRTDRLKLVMKTGRTQATIHGVDPADFPDLLWEQPEPDIRHRRDQLLHQSTQRAAGIESI